MAKLSVFAAATIILCAMVTGSSAQDTLDTLQDKLSQALWLGKLLLLEKGVVKSQYPFLSKYLNGKYPNGAESAIRVYQELNTLKLLASLLEYQHTLDISDEEPSISSDVLQGVANDSCTHLKIIMGESFNCESESQIDSLIAQVTNFQSVTKSYKSFKKLCRSCSTDSEHWIKDNIACSGDGIIARNYIYRNLKYEVGCADATTTTATISVTTDSPATILA